MWVEDGMVDFTTKNVEKKKRYKKLTKFVHPSRRIQMSTKFSIWRWSSLNIFENHANLITGRVVVLPSIMCFIIIMNDLCNSDRYSLFSDTEFCCSLFNTWRIDLYKSAYGLTSRSILSNANIIHRSQPAFPWLCNRGLWWKYCYHQRRTNCKVENSLRLDYGRHSCGPFAWLTLRLSLVVVRQIWL